MQETWVQSLGQEDLLEKEMATHSSTLAWRILCREEPGRLRSMGLQRVGHDWATSLSLSTHSSILAWRISWTQGTGELQSMGSRRARHNWMSNNKVSYLLLVIRKQENDRHCLLPFFNHEIKISPECLAKRKKPLKRMLIILICSQ